jgi:hypothetical protein
LGINQSLGARKKEIEKILLNKKLLNPTDPKDRNRNKKIEAITKDISQIAIDSFKVNSKRLDQLVEDWINSEPDPQAP